MPWNMVLRKIVMKLLKIIYLYLCVCVHVFLYVPTDAREDVGFPWSWSHR